MVSGKPGSSSKGPALVVYLVHVVELNVALCYESCLVKNDLSPFVFLNITMEKCEGNKRSQEVGQK